MSEQKNRYKGKPNRPWLRLQFLAREGSQHNFELLADTGCPHAIILKEESFEKLVLRRTRDISTNFGPMRGGWIRLYSRDLGLVVFVEAFGSDRAATAASLNHPDFAGLVGLPILRLAEYGGNSEDFWIRTPANLDSSHESSFPR